MVKINITRGTFLNVNKVVASAQDARVFIASTLGLSLPLSAPLGIQIGNYFDEVNIVNVTRTFGTYGEYPGLYTIVFTHV